jgi:spore cortex formation protein SpoVR/YcgB (stage V sporulation)
MKPINSQEDFSAPRIMEIWDEIAIIAREELGMEVGKNLYINQFEIVTAEQLLDAYASIGLPVNYHHWSFGKRFVENERSYAQGRMGLALEMVINSNPCINYLSEQNTMIEQAMVIAHAAIGHNFCFANNVYFKEWTAANNIVDYMVFARDFISRCEDQYGRAEVEKVIDACHAIATHSIDKYKRRQPPKINDEIRLQKILEEDDRRQRELDIVLRKTSLNYMMEEAAPDSAEVDQEENILYFIMKKAPNTPQWKREIMRICYKVESYFQHQGLTKVLNEGIATFVHYYIMRRLEEKGHITSDAYIKFLSLHSSVIAQHSKSRFNPYKLGFEILQDVVRICTEPTDEDRQWFPNLIGRDWRDVVKEAVVEYRDDSFIQQFLSPKVMRDFGMYSILVDYDQDDDYATVQEIQDDIGYSNLRTQLAQSYERINYVPEIAVVRADLEGDRTLHLRYKEYAGRTVDVDDARDVIRHLKFLWGYPVSFEIPD